jgi:hypothetical protein
VEDLGLHVTIILKYIIKKDDGRMWDSLVWFRIGTSGRFF